MRQADGELGTEDQRLEVQAGAVLTDLLETLASALRHPGLGQRSARAMAVLPGFLQRPYRVKEWNPIERL